MECEPPFDFAQDKPHSIKGTSPGHAQGFGAASIGDAEPGEVIQLFGIAAIV